MPGSGLSFRITGVSERTRGVWSRDGLGVLDADPPKIPTGQQKRPPRTHPGGRFTLPLDKEDSHISHATKLLRSNSSGV
jgi:hypothetical protein